MEPRDFSLPKGLFSTYLGMVLNMWGGVISNSKPKGYFSFPIFL